MDSKTRIILAGWQKKRANCFQVTRQLTVDRREELLARFGFQAGGFPAINAGRHVFDYRPMG